MGDARFEFLVGLQVDGLAADDPGQGMGAEAYPHPLARHDPAVDAGGGIGQGAVLPVAPHHHAHLVHVGRHHDPGARAGPVGV